MVCLVAATLLWPALAQAPGDRENDCGDDDHTYPSEWHVLFDTWNYVDLFDGGPLRVLNNDGGSGVSISVASYLHELWISLCLIQILCHSVVIIITCRHVPR